MHVLEFEQQPCMHAGSKGVAHSVPAQYSDHQNKPQSSQTRGGEAQKQAPKGESKSSIVLLFAATAQPLPHTYITRMLTHIIYQ